MNNSVSFTGYRHNKYNFSTETRKLVYQKLICEVSACIKYGYEKYFFGGASGFDLLAAYAVIYLKKAFDIKLICALPYENFHLSNEFDEEWRKLYLSVIPKCDDVINVSGKKENELAAYMMRNKFMVDNSDILICLYDGKKGGTQNSIQYAQQKGLRIINILPL